MTCTARAYAQHFNLRRALESTDKCPFCWYMLAKTAAISNPTADRMASMHLHDLDDDVLQIQPPEWAENLLSRAIIYHGSQSPAISFNLSHADLTATLACVARAGIFVGNEDQHNHRAQRETTESTDMSIVTLSSPSIHSSSAYYSAYISPQNLSSQTSAISDTRTKAHAFESPKFVVSERNDSVTPPSTSSALHHPAPPSIAIDHSSPSSRFELQIAPLSFTFSIEDSPAWTASDEAALQLSNHHTAHYPLLVNIFRHLTTNIVPGRQYLPSEEAAVVAAFLKNYPLPGTTAPHWEVAEWAGMFNAIALMMVIAQHFLRLTFFVDLLNS